MSPVKRFSFARSEAISHPVSKSVLQGSDAYGLIPGAEASISEVIAILNLNPWSIA